MANTVTYTLNWTDPGKGNIVLDPATIDVSTTSLSLLGQGYPNYGEAHQENFLKLLDNFASPDVPSGATTGQLWYDTVTKDIKVKTDTVWSALAHKQYVDDGINGVVLLVDNMFHNMDGLTLKNLHGPNIDLISLAPADGNYNSPSIRMFHPDNAIELGGPYGTYGWSAIAPRDGKVLSILANSGISTTVYNAANEIHVFSISQPDVTGNYNVDVHGNIVLNNHRVVGMLAPLVGTDGANKSYVDDAVAAGIVSPGVGAGSKHTIWVPAGAISLVLPGPVFSTIQTLTYKIVFKTIDFDSTVAEYGQFSVRMPKSWDRGPVSAVVVWSTTGTGTATWGVHAVALSNGDVLDSVFGAIAKQSSAATPNTLVQTSVIGPISTAGAPASEDTVVFQVFRDVADVNDTLTIDARLHGIVVLYDIDRLTDA